MIKIVIADDHDITLHGLVVFVNNIENCTVVGKAKNGKEVLEILKTTQADIILSDVDMPDMDGLQLLKTINKKYPQLKVLACTMHINSWTLKKLIKNNVAGIVSKHEVLDDIQAAINSVITGNTFLSEEVRQIISVFSDQKKNTSKYFEIRLTTREKEVLSLIANEMTTSEIAKLLEVSINTIETHRHSLFMKFDVKNAVGLIKKAIEREMV